MDHPRHIRDRLGKVATDAWPPSRRRCAKRAAAQPPGAGKFARQWNEVFALAMLGRHEAACAAYRDSVEAGMVTHYDFAEHAPELAAFRAQPCYPRVVSLARQRAEAEIAKARAANLLPG